MHVDDGSGIASSVKMRDYIEGGVSQLYACKMTNWQNILGYTTNIDDLEHTVSFSAYPMVKQLGEEHLSERAISQLKMPYMGSIMSVEGGVKPLPGSPELAEYLILESKTRSILGSWSRYGFSLLLKSQSGWPVSLEITLSTIQH